MSDQIEQPVYLGVPITGHTLTKEEEADPYTSKIGGKPAWLRPVKPIATNGDRKDSDGDVSEFACPKCKSCSQTRLLSQLHCPLTVFDRILYVFMCLKCSHKTDESYVFCLRSQQYNPDYEEAVSAGGGEEEVRDKGPMFAVDDDDGWGDETEEPVPAAAAPSPPVVEAPVAVPKYEVYNTATREDQRDSNMAVTTTALPGLALDTFEEPKDESTKRKQKKHHSMIVDDVPSTIEEAEALIQRNMGGAGDEGDVVEGNDNTDDATEEGTVDEKQMDDFVKRMGRCPSQCVRWSPDGVPLTTTVSKQPPRASDIPHCEECGAPRRFEFQLMPPTLYFFDKLAPQQKHQSLPKMAGDANPKQVQELMNKLSQKDDPHFSTVSVFTCSESCYFRRMTAAVEYVHVEPEQ